MLYFANTTSTITVDVQSVDERIPSLANRYPFIHTHMYKYICTYTRREKFILIYAGGVRLMGIKFLLSADSLRPDCGQRGYRDDVHVLRTRRRMSDFIFRALADRDVALEFCNQTKTTRFA